MCVHTIEIIILVSPKNALVTHTTNMPYTSYIFEQFFLLWLKCVNTNSQCSNLGICVYIFTGYFWEGPTLPEIENKIFTHTFKRSRLKLIVCATFLSILVMPKIVKKKILIICAKSSYFFSNMLKSHLHLVG